MQPAQVHDAVEHAEFDKRPDSLRGHRAHNGRSYGLVPCHTEIGLSTDGEDKGQGAITTIEVLEGGIVQHDQHSGVNELANEDGDHSVVSLEGHSLESETLDQVDKDDFKGEVDTDNEEGNTHGDEANRGTVRKDLMAGLHLATI